jgi:hypothetical protein
LPILGIVQFCPQSRSGPCGKAYRIGARPRSLGQSQWSHAKTPEEVGDSQLPGNMKHLFQEKQKEALLHRLARIQGDSQRAWGKMNVHQMLVHVADPFRAALLERPVPYHPSILGRFPVNKLVSQWLPWPKGSPTAPEFIQGVKGSALAEFEKDKQAVVELIRLFVQHGDTRPFPPHPVFGKLSNRQWARVMWRHLDHHLRQFSC